MFRYLCIFVLIALSVVSCDSSSQTSDNFIKNILLKNEELFGEIVENADEYKVQIIYTQINRTKANEPKFAHHFWGYSPSEYFYPASLIKLPVAALAIERLRKLPNQSLDVKSVIDVLRTPNSAKKGLDIFAPPDCFQQKSTLAEYVKKCLIVSSNDAYNHLFEFAGKSYIYDRLNEMGYDKTRIKTWLWSPCFNQYNRTIEGFVFTDSVGNEVYKHKNDTINQNFEPPIGQVVLGKNRVDFTNKNYIDLFDIHQIVISIMMPDFVPSKSRFNIEKSDYELLQKYMGLRPKESDLIEYNGELSSIFRAVSQIIKALQLSEDVITKLATVDFHDSYTDYLYYGSRTKSIENQSLRIFNKVGLAYGFVSECAYFVDADEGVEFFLSAVIYTNENNIVGDDNYEYYEIAMPFMENLGRVFYEYEKNRNRKIQPDLQKYMKLFGDE